MCRLTRSALQTCLLMVAVLAGCDAERDEPATTTATAAVDDGKTTWGRLPFARVELEVECPPGWSCKPDDEGRLRHKRLAASVSLRRSSATDAASLVKAEQLLRVQERRILVDETPHDLGLVQETRQQVRGGAESRSWSLLRRVADQPAVCTGTASTTDYPDLVAEFDTICSSLTRPTVVPEAPEPAPAPAAGAPADGGLFVPPGPALPTALGLQLGMSPAQVAAAQPALADDGALAMGPWSVRAGFWGVRQTLTTLTATASGDIDTERTLADAIEAWGPPTLLDGGEARAWTVAETGIQAVIDAPTRGRLRVTWREVTSVDAILGQTPDLLGFELPATPLLGLSRQQLAGHYAGLVVGDPADARLALPPLPEGGVTVVDLSGDPIDELTVHLDTSRRPAAARAIEVAVEQRLGAVERIDVDGRPARRGTDGTRTWTLVSHDDGRLDLVVR